jgi:hypothetical protein
MNKDSEMRVYFPVQLQACKWAQTKLLLADYLSGLLLPPEHGGSVFLRNTSELTPDYAVSYPGRPPFPVIIAAL